MTKKYLSQKQKIFDGTPKGRIRKYRFEAKRRNLIFELSLEDFIKIISQNCYYCDADKSIGVDRKDNKIGYTLNNSVPCCTECNYLKRAHSEVFFIQKCKDVSKKWS